jgi:cytoskeletal protein CcmA (bactofilin family)
MSTTVGNSKNVLGADVEIKGHLKFTGELTFEGKLEGEIHTDGILNLGDSAVINGNIDAQSVVVRGKVNGNINAKEKIDIKAKTELFGDIRAAKLVIEEGVTFVGKTDVNPNKVSPTAGPARAGVEPKGYVFNTEAVVGDATIKGRFLGKLAAEHSLTIFSTAEIKGSFKTARLIIR